MLTVDYLRKEVVVEERYTQYTLKCNECGHIYQCTNNPEKYKEAEEEMFVVQEPVWSSAGHRKPEVKHFCCKGCFDSYIKKYFVDNFMK